MSEFKAMVRAVHAAGLEIVLDVVYNHTAEGNHLGPTLCFRGLDNPRYYRLDRRDQSLYLNWTGTGNTVDLTQDEALRPRPRQPPLLGRGHARGRLPLRSRHDPRTH